MDSVSLTVALGSAEHQFFRQMADGSGVSLDAVGDTATFASGDGSQQVVVTVGRNTAARN